jgi:CHAD domain-containing protein
LAEVIHLQLNSNVTILSLIRAIEKKYRVRKIKSIKKSVSYLDTFDWRLYRNNLVLKYEDKLLQLENINNQNSPQNHIVSKFPVFIADVAESDLKNNIKKIIQVRALQPVGRIIISSNEYNVLDRNEKTVLRLRIDSISRVGKYISIEALRGYANQIDVINSLLKSQTEETNPKIIFEKIIKLNGKIAADYDPRIKVQLQPEMQSGKATKLILKNLVETMVKNETGVIKDIDTEFLHDFRVASRRTRAALTQIKNVFEPAITEQFNNLFTMLGKKTNKLRDLDVYLLNKNDYIKRLPENMQNDINPFFDGLLIERKTEVKIFVRFLKSEFYKTQLKEYYNFLKVSGRKNELAFNANKPIKNLATEFIITQYNKVMKQGNKIKVDSPDALYHKLRIQCKKLRYLLEFFSSLFPQDKITLLIDQLKKLQDNLGLFNDLFVQQETLKEYSQKDDINTSAILSLGYLIGKLNDEQIEVRNAFHKTFMEFSNKKNNTLFNELFVTSRG